VARIKTTLLESVMSKGKKQLEAVKKYQQSEKGKATMKAYRSSEHFKEIEHDSFLKRKYGVSLDWKKAKYEEQKGLCALCGKPLPDVFASHLDHNHLTGQNRDLLHKFCNLIVDLVEDNPHLVGAAFKYVYTHGGVL